MAKKFTEVLARTTSRQIAWVLTEDFEQSRQEAYALWKKISNLADKVSAEASIDKNLALKIFFSADEEDKLEGKLQWVTVHEFYRLMLDISYYDLKDDVIIRMLGDDDYAREALAAVIAEGKLQEKVKLKIGSLEDELAKEILREKLRLGAVPKGKDSKTDMTQLSIDTGIFHERVMTTRIAIAPHFFDGDVVDGNKYPWLISHFLDTKIDGYKFAFGFHHQGAKTKLYTDDKTEDRLVYLPVMCLDRRPFNILQSFLPVAENPTIAKKYAEQIKFEKKIYNLDGKEVEEEILAPNQTELVKNAFAAQNIFKKLRTFGAVLADHDWAHHAIYGINFMAKVGSPTERGFFTPNNSIAKRVDAAKGIKFNNEAFPHKDYSAYAMPSNQLERFSFRLNAATWNEVFKAKPATKRRFLEQAIELVDDLAQLKPAIAKAYGDKAANDLVTFITTVVMNSLHLVIALDDADLNIPTKKGRTIRQAVDELGVNPYQPTINDLGNTDILQNELYYSRDGALAALKQMNPRDERLQPIIKSLQNDGMSNLGAMDDDGNYATLALTENKKLTPEDIFGMLMLNYITSMEDTNEAANSENREFTALIGFLNNRTMNQGNERYDNYRRVFDKLGIEDGDYRIELMKRAATAPISSATYLIMHDSFNALLIESFPDIKEKEISAFIAERKAKGGKTRYKPFELPLEKLVSMCDVNHHEVVFRKTERYDGMMTRLWIEGGRNLVGKYDTSKDPNLVDYIDKYRIALDECKNDKEFHAARAKFDKTDTYYVKRLNDAERLARIKKHDDKSP